MDSIAGFVKFLGGLALLGVGGWLVLLILSNIMSFLFPQKPPRKLTHEALMVYQEKQRKELEIEENKKAEKTQTEELKPETIDDLPF